MFSKNKKTNSKTKNKVSNYVFNPFFRSTVHHTGTSQTDLLYKSVDWFLYNRKTLQSLGLIITAKISTYLQRVHAHLITCQFIVILALKHFAFGSFLIESGT